MTEDSKKLLIRERQQLEQEWCELRKLQAQYKQLQAGSVPPGFVLVPKRMTKAMEHVTEQEDWTWGDLLAAAEAITEAEYSEMAQAEAVPTDALGSEWAPCIKRPVVVHVRNQRPGEKHVSTREGITPVKPDDLIMRGISGEEYPIGRAIFEQTYDFVDAAIAQQKGQP